MLNLKKIEFLLLLPNELEEEILGKNSEVFVLVFWLSPLPVKAKAFQEKMETREEMAPQGKTERKKI